MAHSEQIQLSLHPLLSGLLGLNPNKHLGIDKELSATQKPREEKIEEQETLNDTNHSALEE